LTHRTKGMAPSPPPLSTPLPVITLPPLAPPLSFCWLLRFLVPQPLPLVTSPPSALASAIHPASTFFRATLVRLVVTLPGASTPPSRRDSTRCRLSLHPSHSVGVSHCLASWSIVRMVVMLPLVTASCASTALVRDSVWHRLPPLPPPYPSRTKPPSPEREQGLPKHCHFRCHCSVHLLPVGPPPPFPSSCVSSRKSVASVEPPPPLPSSQAPAARVWPRGGSESKWMMSSVPVTPLELGQRASCVS